MAVQNQGLSRFSNPEPLSNFQELAWRQLFTNDIHPLLEESSYEDNNIRITYKACNAEEFVKIQKVTDLSGESLEEDFLVDVTVESKASNSDLKEITYPAIPITTIPLLTASGFYIQGTSYGILSESTLAPGWYFLREPNKYVLEHRSKYGVNLSITYKDGKFAVRLKKRNQNNSEYLDLWTFLKGISGSESYSDILRRLNMLDLFVNDYIRVQREQERNNPPGSIYSEPSIEECAEKVLNAYNRYVSTDGDCVSYLQTIIFTENLMNFAPERIERFKRACGFSIAVGLQLAQDVDLGSEGRLKKGTTLTAEDVQMLDRCNVDCIYIQHQDKSYKLFEVSIEENPTMNEIIAAIYYWGLVIEGIGKLTDPDDFINKNTRTISTVIANFISQQLDQLTDKIVSNYTTTALTSLTKLFNKLDLRMIYSASLRDKIFSDPSYTMKDETNSISAFQQSYKLTSAAKGLGKRARAVRQAHFGRVCSFTTPESKPVGLNLSLTLGSQVENGYITYPVYKVVKGVRTSQIEMLTDTKERNKIIAPYSANLDTEGDPEELIPDCRLNGEVIEARRKDIVYQDKSSMQTISPVLLFVPSFNRDAGKRLTMAANAITQARQPVRRKRPYCSTGVEAMLKVNVQTARDILESCMTTQGFDTSLIRPDTTITLIEVNDSFEESKDSTVASYGTELVFTSNIAGFDRFPYVISRLQPATNSSIKHQRVRHVKGNTYALDDVVVTSNDTDDKEYELSKSVLEFGKEKVSSDRLKDSAVAIGENITFLFKAHEGFGYEDSVIVKESFAKKYGLATANITRIRSDATIERDAAGNEISYEVFSNDTYSLEPGSSLQYNHLDSEGLAKLGVSLKPDQVVIGKKIIKRNKQINKPVKLAVGQQGTVINRFIVKGKSTKTKSVSTANVVLGSLSLLSQGDKVGGLHGNKGVIGRIVPDVDMPYCKFGVPDFIINSLGVISRTNIGQTVEAVMGMIGMVGGKIEFLEPFSDMTIDDMLNKAQDLGVTEVDIYDGRTGRKYERKAFMGNMYFLRSAHTSTSKFNACGLTDVKRNSVSMQPLKCAGGGQRIGELLANAFRGHNAVKVLDSLFTTQSDDIESCNQLVKNISSGHAFAPVDVKLDNFELFQAFFRTLGINLVKDAAGARFQPLTNEDIKTLSSYHITTEMLSGYSKQNSADIFLRNTSFMRDYSDTMSLDVAKRKLYTSLELPRPMIMPMVCFGDTFLHMFIIEYEGEYKLMSTVMFKRLLQSEVILSDKNFKGIPVLMKRAHANAVNIPKEQRLEGVEALMCIFERYDLRYTIKALEQLLESLDVRGFEPFPEANEIILRKEISSLVIDAPLPEDQVSVSNEIINSITQDSVADDDTNNVSNEVFKTSEDTDEYGLDIHELASSTEEVSSSEGILEDGEKSEEATEEGPLEAVEEPESGSEVVPSEVIGTSDAQPEEGDGRNNKQKNLKAGANATRLLGIRGNVINFYKNQDIKSYFVSSILIPPIAYRPDFEGRLASPIDKQLLSLIGKLQSYAVNGSPRGLNSIYRELFWMVVHPPKAKKNEKNILETIISHENKNSKVRDTLFAKRVTASARSVIVVNPTLRIDECKVPISIATVQFMTLLLADREGYFPILNSYKASSKRQDNGKKFYESLFHCLANDNLIDFKNMLNLQSTNYLDLKNIFDKCKQELWEALTRYLDTYPYLLNREPSLHKFNVMAFHGLLTDGYAYELHPLACRPYNADFDGDQMAGLVPFVAEAVAECKDKMIQHNNLINPNNGELIVELNQDMILGLYWLTMLPSNQKEIKNPNFRKGYRIDTGCRYLTYQDKIRSDLESGKLQPTSVVLFESEGRRCIGLAEDALYCMVSDRIDEDAGAYLLINGRRIPSNYSIAGMYTSDSSSNYAMLMNNYDGYRNKLFAELWCDIDNGVLKPQDFIMLRLDGRLYRSTIGRVLFNSLIPEGLGFTDVLDDSVKTSSGSRSNCYKLKYDFTVNSKMIKKPLHYLRDMFLDISDKMRESEVNLDEREIISRCNIRFSEVLDRLKDVGFRMSDESCISISLFDFRNLELARTNVATREVYLEKLRALSSLSKDEALAEMRQLLMPLDSLLMRVTTATVVAPDRKFCDIAIGPDHLKVLLNDQQKTPRDYVLNCKKPGDFGRIMTIAQAIMCDVLETDLSFPLTLPQMMEEIAKAKTTKACCVKASRAISELINLSSKLGIKLSDFIPGSIEALTKFTGINLMRHKLKVVEQKYLEGRLTVECKQKLTVNIVSEYEKQIKQNISSTLEDSRNSNLFIMTDSGARGSMTQLMQVCGVIGSVTDDEQKLISSPILSNLLTGLNPRELFTSSYHDRTILVNTQLDIPKSGELNRQLSYSTEYLKIRPESIPDEIFCGADSIEMPLKWKAEIPSGVTIISLVRDLDDEFDYAWDRFMRKFMANMEPYTLNSESLKFVKECQEELGMTSVSVVEESLDSMIVKVHISELREGMQLYLCDWDDAFVQKFQQQFIRQAVLDDSVVLYLTEEFITTINSIEKDKCVKREINYKLDQKTRDLVFYRSVDESKLDPQTAGLFESTSIKKYAPEDSTQLLAKVVGNKFLDALETNHCYITTLPIYTIINCKCENGICRKCYGLKYDTYIMPEPSELIGFQGVQAVCATLSQMILDTHKAGAGTKAGNEVKSIRQLIDRTIEFSSKVELELSKLYSEVVKNSNCRDNPDRLMDNLNRFLTKSALSVLIKDKQTFLEIQFNQEISDAQAQETTQQNDWFQQLALDASSRVMRDPAKYAKLSSEELKDELYALTESCCFLKGLNEAIDDLVTCIETTLPVVTENSGEVQKLIMLQEIRRTYSRIEKLLDNGRDSVTVTEMYNQARNYILGVISEHATGITWCYDELSTIFETVLNEDTIVKFLEDEFVGAVFDATYSNSLIVSSQLLPQYNHSISNIIDSAVVDIVMILNKAAKDSYTQSIGSQEKKGNNRARFLTQKGSRNSKASDNNDTPGEEKNPAEKQLMDYFYQNNTDEDLTLFVRLQVWFDLIKLLQNKDVLARNLELFPRSMGECGRALADKPDGSISYGCIYKVTELIKAGVPYAPVKLAMQSALGYNGQVIADTFLGNTRQNMIKHIVNGTNDIGSPIAGLITGTGEIKVEQPYKGSNTVGHSINVAYAADDFEDTNEFDSVFSKKSEPLASLWDSSTVSDDYDPKSISAMDPMLVSYSRSISSDEATSEPIVLPSDPDSIPFDLSGSTNVFGDESAQEEEQAESQDSQKDELTPIYESYSFEETNVFVSETEPSEVAAKPEVEPESVPQAEVKVAAEVSPTVDDEAEPQVEDARERIRREILEELNRMQAVKQEASISTGNAEIKSKEMNLAEPESQENSIFEDLGINTGSLEDTTFFN